MRAVDDSVDILPTVFGATLGRFGKIPSEDCACVDSPKTFIKCRLDGAATGGRFGGGVRLVGEFHGEERDATTANERVADDSFR